MQKQIGFYGLVVFFFLLLIGAYWNHFNNPFQFDDAHTIVNNDAIRSLKNIPSFFKDAKTTSSLPANQIYRPGLTTLNAIDFWIAGKPEPEPFYFHVSIFISYCILGVLLYFLLLKLFDESIKHKWNRYFALFGAAFYCLHTANAETINYVIARSDSFSTLMIVLSMIIYLYKPQWRKKLIYLIPVLIGFFVKEPTIMIAPLLVIYILLFAKNISIPKWFSIDGIKAGFGVLFMLFPLFVLITGLFILSGVMASDTFDPGGISRFEYILSQPFVIVHYFNNFILPFNLSADTDWTTISNIFDDRVIAGSLFILLMIGVAIYSSTKKTLLPISFGIIWFFMALLPTSVMPLSEVLNDHRPFFPYIGLVIAFVWLFALLSMKFENNIEKKILLKAVFVVFPILIICSHAYGTRQRNKVWSSGETLWYDVTIKSPNNGRGLMNYGLALMRNGNFIEAQKYYERAQKLIPNYSYLYINMGVLKSYLGNSAEAEANFKYALTLNPGNPECYYYYANWLRSQGKYKEAFDVVEQGLKHSPDHIGNKTLYQELQILTLQGKEQLQVAEENATKNPSVDNYISLSLIYYQLQEYEKCIKASEEALKIKPNCIEAYNNICSAHNMLGNYDEAVLAGQQALKIDPNYQLAKNNLADALNRKMKVDDILRLAEKEPTELNYINLSLAYYNLGNYQKCVEASLSALKANPNSDAAYNNICCSYNMLKQWDKAIAAGEKGLKINPDNQLLRNNLAVSVQGKGGN